MRAPERGSPKTRRQPEEWFSPADAPARSQLVTYPTDRKAEPVLYGPKGEPLYYEPEPFGYAAGRTEDT